MRSSSDTRLEPQYFKHLFDRCAEALALIFLQDKHADKVIESYFRQNKKWGKRDRHFFAETVYECVRWWNQLIWLSLENPQPSHPEEFHRIIAAYFIKTEKHLPPWYSSYKEDILKKLKNNIPPYIQHAIPEWLYQRGQEELGSAVWETALLELNRPAQVVLRANTLKTSREEFLKRAQTEEIEALPIANPKVPNGVLLKKRKNIFATDLFQEGFCEVQDASSQLVAPFLAPQPGERIVDACAGAGGKSLHIAALMENKGKIIALDIHEWKLQELQKRARRAGVYCLETRTISTNKVIKRLKHAADAVLLDVPCSGLGVLKRNPDTKWKLSPERFDELQELQRMILQDYSQMVKPGGRLVYSTCSILPSENSNIVQHFIKANPEWALVKDQAILPSDNGFDGFYMALLQHTQVST